MATNCKGCNRRLPDCQNAYCPDCKYNFGINTASVAFNMPRYVVYSNVNFRKGPSTNYDKHMTLGMNAKVMYNGIKQKGGDYNWANCKYNNAEGWIADKYMSDTPAPTGSVSTPAESKPEAGPIPPLANDYEYEYSNAPDITSILLPKLRTVARIAQKKPYNFVWFISQVDNEKPWDLKREKGWTQTMTTMPYPGSSQSLVKFNGKIMTLEYLGNYTYGYIGSALGFEITVLIGGSYYKAGFPTKGEDLHNEFKDWTAIRAGQNFYWVDKLRRNI